MNQDEISSTKTKSAGSEEYRARVSSGIASRRLRHWLYSPVPKFGVVSFLVLSLLGVGVTWLGVRMLAGQSLWAVFLGLLSFVVGRGRGRMLALFGLLFVVGGVTLGLVGLIMLAVGIYCFKVERTMFRDGLLMPGVVTSKDPLIILALADMKKTDHGQEYALGRVDPRWLPTVSHEPGTRVPCVASFSDDVGDGWLFFRIHPITWATGDAFDIERCFEKLGSDPFRKLEACIARGPVPTFEHEIAMLDRDLNFVEMRTLADTVGLRKAYEAQVAGDDKA